jgi:hypothetical protein
MTHDKIKEFFDRYGQALGGSDLDGVAECYFTPALVVSESATIEVANPDAVRSAFAGAAEAYASKGVVGANADIRAVDRLTEGLSFVTVVWEYVDSQGGTQPGESYRYLLRHGANGTGICVVVPLD